MATRMLRRLVALLALLALGALAWFAWSRGREGTDPAPAQQRPGADAQPGVTLDARPLPPGSTRKTPSPPLPPVEAPPKAGPPAARPVRGSDTAPQTPTRGVLIRVRLELVDSGGRGETIAVESVTVAGEEWPAYVEGTEPAGPRVQPGTWVVVTTADPRAALSNLRVQAPDPVPPEILIQVPARGDPRLSRLTLEVVDAQSGKPLPDAVLDWGEGEFSTGSQHADEAGRIVLPVPADPNPPEGLAKPALVRFLAAARFVHAPGHFGAGSTLHTDHLQGVSVPDLARWLETGLFRVALEPFPDVKGVESRTVRLVYADASPAEGVYVHISWPLLDDDFLAFPGLTPGWEDGFRRLGSDGLLTVPVRDVVALAVRVGRTPIGLWGLAKSAWPASGPRTLTLPALAELDLAIDGLPAGRGAWWDTDPLGASRTRQDRPLLGPTLDEASTRILLDSHRVLRDTTRGSWGELTSPRSVLAFPIVVGRPQTIQFRASGERRHLDVRADAPGPLRLTRRWEDLPKDE